MINYEHFSQVELRTAKVLSAERVEGSDKLLKLQLDLGEKSEAGESMPLQIIAGIGKAYEPEALIGKSIVIVANLEPRALLGLTSNGMLLAASGEDGPVLLVPDREIPPGSKIR
ncbi:MAG: methionine--tRNA ligase subunit beta [bacterium]|nr:methionine--tRNA ligase subunit beta [bacterium]